MHDPLLVLVVCEESQRVCSEFRALGCDAFSCDLLPCSGGHPEWHIQGDALDYINGRCHFVTSDGTPYFIAGSWDLLICHPPCTYLSLAGNRHFNVSKYGDRALHRFDLRADAFDFFMSCVNADCDHICIENPCGFPNTAYKSPNQVIHPYFFADSVYDLENYHLKRTCLWLKNLPLLVYPELLPHPVPISFDNNERHKPRYFVDMCVGADRQKLRSKTFPGIAKAMAEQWFYYLCQFEHSCSYYYLF